MNLIFHFVPTKNPGTLLEGQFMSAQHRVDTVCAPQHFNYPVSETIRSCANTKALFRNHEDVDQEVKGKVPYRK